MDFINRYVYAVTKSFAEKQREDIEKELRANIEDMIEQNQGPESYEEKAKKVLLELGDPEVLADDYRGSKRYLIGPQYYETYILVLKIVIGAVFAGISIAIFVESFFLVNENIGSITAENITKITTNYFAALFSGVLQAFAWTTIAFMIAERKNTKINKEHLEKSKWNLSKLPAVPDKKAGISLSNSIFRIIFATIFYTILYSAPQFFAVYLSRGNETIGIPVFNLEVLQGYRVLIMSILILSILIEMLKIYYRRWMLKLSVIHVILTVIATVLALIIVTDSSVWNPNFVTEIIKHFNLTFDFASLTEKIKSWVVAVMVLSSSIEIITVLYKGICYNTKKY
ncbi:hypothetical protein [Oceanirhabdus seepicola]|uniref:Uncharacterized protein n=1 Tax=Oceanirhabdus seepicola TaxID=2828781 RepID=A0A9J6NYC1_9CLOT|nr:hypothetical protein [Oceanirhabdus seepicola]MCM1988889.1 hypothetical protein [Oceanirhabdus seepicola]